MVYKNTHENVIPVKLVPAGFKQGMGIQTLCHPEPCPELDSWIVSESLNLIQGAEINLS